MKKFGFTLAEVLVTIGIIGVVAALATPSLLGLMPDKNKVQVLKVYNNVSKITKEMVNNPTLYNDEDYNGKSNSQCDPNNSNTNCCVGLQCTNIPNNAEELVHEKYPNLNYYPSYFWGAADKYINLLALNLDVAEGGQYGLFSSGKFTTTDGISWNIKWTYSNSGALITIDTDSSDNSPNCSYSNSCKKPDQFKFFVDKYGNVKANDPLTKAYLDNPSKLNDRNNDLKKAKENISLTWIQGDSPSPPIRPR